MELLVSVELFEDVFRGNWFLILELMRGKCVMG